MQARFISALYPFLFFVCLIFALRHRSSEIREHINGECGRLEEACRALADDVRNHAGFDKFSTKMSDTPTGKELRIIIENKSQVKEVKRGNHKRGRKPRAGKRDRPNN